MDLDERLRHYFGSDDPAAIPVATLVAGRERMRVDLGLERDRERRFALWTMLHLLGDAPDVDATFADRDDRAAARRLMDVADRVAGR